MEREEMLQQQVIATATELGVLRERQRGLVARIQQLEEVLRSLTAHLAHDRSSRAKPPTKSGIKATQLPLVSDAPISERIVRFLSENPGKKFSPSMIAKAVGSTNMTTVRTTLYRLSRTDRILRAARGRYAALT